MNKIIAIALESKGFKDLDGLMEVIAATGNPEVATELLLGCYESPTIRQHPNTSRYAKRLDEIAHTFCYFDKFKGTVHYKYNLCPYTEIWVNKNVDSLPTYDEAKDNETMRIWDASMVAKKLNITVEEFRQGFERKTVYDTPKTVWSTGSCDLSDWQDDTNIMI